MVGAARVLSVSHLIATLKRFENCVHFVQPLAFALYNPEEL